MSKPKDRVALTKVDTLYILLRKEVMYVYTTIQKWGNSHAIRLPKALLEMTELNENDSVEIRVQDGNLVIIPVKKHITLKERIAEYKGDYKCSEWDTGKPLGKEVF